MKPTINTIAVPDTSAMSALRNSLEDMYVETKLLGLAAAIAISRGLGGAITLLIDRDQETVHAFVKLDGGQCFDASGTCPYQTIEKRYRGKALWPPEQIDEENVFGKYDQEHETAELKRHITKVGIMLETAYPDWPWVNRPSVAISRFLADITEICREHDMWIASPTPGNRPQVALDQGEDGDGFTAHLSVFGNGFTLERVYGRQD